MSTHSHHPEPVAESIQKQTPGHQATIKETQLRADSIRVLVTSKENHLVNPVSEECSYQSNGNDQGFQRSVENSHKKEKISVGVTSGHVNGWALHELVGLALS